MTEVIIDGKRIGKGSPAYVVAEIGFNHGGDLRLAVEMIAAAAEAGVDAVKFQTFRAPELVLESAEHFVVVRDGELSPEDHVALRDTARACGVTFFSTPFDVKSVEMLEKLNVPAYKVASMDLTNLPLLRYIARLGKPMIVSTGMASLKEILRAANVIQDEGNRQIILLHCVSMYPASPEDVNLHFMTRLRKMFQTPVGYSDHTVGNAAPLAAISIGACLIEKHFTTDKFLPGPDHSISADRADMKKLVDDIRTAEKSLGEWKSAFQRPDRKNAKTFRRGVFAKVDIPAGAVISDGMIKCVRPEAEILPECAGDLVGRSAKRPIQKDQPIRWEDL